MLKNVKHAFAGLVLAGLLVGGGATAASAGTAFVNFDVTMPRWQQGVDVAKQTKAGGLQTNSTARIDSIGGSRKANLRTIRWGASQSGTEVFGVSAGTTRSLNSPFAKGAVMGMRIHNNGWEAIRVQITGAFRSN